MPMTEDTNNDREPIPVKISMDRKLVYIRTKYDPEIVKAIRSVKGRTWNPFEKKWMVPRRSYNELLKKLEALPVDISIIDHREPGENSDNTS